MISLISWRNLSLKGILLRVSWYDVRYLYRIVLNLWFALFFWITKICRCTYACIVWPEIFLFFLGCTVQMQHQYCTCTLILRFWLLLNCPNCFCPSHEAIQYHKFLSQYMLYKDASDIKMYSRSSRYNLFHVLPAHIHCNVHCSSRDAYTIPYTVSHSQPGPQDIYCLWLKAGYIIYFNEFILMFN